VNKISGIWLILGFALLAIVDVVQAEVRYVWTDGQGKQQITRESPGALFAYDRYVVPDNLEWRHAPEMPPPISTGAKITTQELFKKASKSVYWVRSDSTAFGATKRRIYGSAVAITEDLALTNCHVVGSGKDQITMGTGEAEETAEAELVAADFDADRCVIQVHGLKMQPVAGVRVLSEADVGESVYAIGNPRHLQRSLSQGLVSGIRDEDQGRLIQTTAPISPGSSGGGLFDNRGNLVGITSMWTRDLDRLAQFYVLYFGATAGPRYSNPAKGFESCFLSFSDGARVEAMTTTRVELAGAAPGTQPFGLTHFAISVGSEHLVEDLAQRLKGDGVPVVDGPRRTGDGYYEAVVLDPDGNRVEICV